MAMQRHVHDIYLYKSPKVEYSLDLLAMAYKRPTIQIREGRFPALPNDVTVRQNLYCLHTKRR